MPGVDVKITGAEKLERLGVELRRAGDKNLTRALHKAMQRAGRPLRADAAASAAAALPRRGGLSAEIGNARNFTVRTTTRGRNVGVRIRSTGKHDIAGMNRGRVRHPVFGGKTWVTQLVDAGWFDAAMNRAAPRARLEIVRALDEVAAQIRTSV
jgi:hypothetical protein